MATPLNTSSASFDALYRDSARDLYAYVRTLLGDDAAAEDVTALAFERAYRRRSSFDAGRGSQRGWLFGIARNAALDELRRRKRAAPLVGELPDEGAPAPEEEADLAVRRTTVRAALAALAPRDRELVALKFHGGLTNAELAAVLGTSESNAGTRVHRAVAKLRRPAMRPRETLTPEQERDLEAIDGALAGAAVESQLRDLEELVLDVRATAPQMSPGFAARLEHELSEGFPAPREQPSRVRRPGRRWLLLPAVGSLAAVVVALVVVFGDGGDQRPLGARAEPAPTASSAARARSTPSVDLNRSQRKVEHSASLALQAPEGGFDSATDAVNATVARFGGSSPARRSVRATPTAARRRMTCGSRAIA